MISSESNAPTQSAWDSISSCIFSSKKSREEVITYYLNSIDPTSYSCLAVYTDIWSVLFGSELATRSDKKLIITDGNDITSNYAGGQSDMNEYNVYFVCSEISSFNCDSVLECYNAVVRGFPGSVCGVICPHAHSLTEVQQTRLQSYNCLLCPDDMMSKYTSFEFDMIRQVVKSSMKKNLLSNVVVSQLESNTPGEDRYSIRLLSDNVKLVIVIDGHGGYLAADVTTNYLADIISKKLTDNGLLSCPCEQVFDILNASFIQLDNKILDQTSQLVNSPTMSIMPGMTKKPIFQLAGCCVVVALVLGNDLYVAHVGDCRAVVFSQSTEEILCSTNEEIYDASYPGRFKNYSVSSSNTTNDSGSHTADLGSYQTVGSSSDSMTQMLLEDEIIIDSVSVSPLNESISSINSLNVKEEISIDPRANESIDDRSLSETSDTSEKQLPTNKRSKQEATGEYLHKRKRNRAPCMLRNSSDWKDIGGDYYRFENDGFQLTCVTTDHSCLVPEERDMVEHLTTDPNPMRPSDMGLKNYGASAPKRVAGSLAITRALGDGYLKRQDVSLPGYREHLPYISSIPAIYHRTVNDSDIAIVLASDGLWNHVNAEECFKILKGAYQNQLNAQSDDILSQQSNLHSLLDDIYTRKCDEKQGFLSIDSHRPQNAFDNMYTSIIDSSTSPNSKPTYQLRSQQHRVIARPYPLPFLPKNDPNFELIVKRLFAKQNDIENESVHSSHGMEAKQPERKRLTKSVVREPISTEMIASDPSRLVTEKLLKQCILNATKNAGIDIASPTCDYTFQSHRIKHRRDILDDVTVVVVSLSNTNLL